MFALLLICVGLFGSLPTGESTASSTTPISKCDKRIQKTIKKFQCHEGRPGRLIDAAVENYIEFVTSTTYGYYAENVTCVWSKFIRNEDNGGATVMIHFVDKYNNTSQKNITVYEKCGKIYDPAPRGPPAFFAKCALGHCTDENLEKAEDVFRHIGYEAPKKYAPCLVEAFF